MLEVVRGTVGLQAQRQQLSDGRLVQRVHIRDAAPGGGHFQQIADLQAGILVPGRQIGPGRALTGLRQPAQGHHSHPVQRQARNGHAEPVAQQHAQLVLHVQDRPVTGHDGLGEPASAGQRVQVIVQNTLVGGVDGADLPLTSQRPLCPGRRAIGV